jgi:hypothetical protein
MFAFDLVEGLFDEVLQEQLGGEGDEKGGVVGALGDVRVDVDDLLDAGHWRGEKEKRRRLLEEIHFSGGWRGRGRIKKTGRERYV